MSSTVSKTRNATESLGAPAPVAPVRRPVERFVELDRGHIVAKLAESHDLSHGERASYVRLMRLVDVALSREYAALRHSVRDVYAALDPDAEARAAAAHEQATTAEQSEFVIAHFGRLLDEASFRRLDLGEIHAAMHAATDWGVNLHVDFGAFDRLEVFARGDMVAKRRVRRWRNLLRPVSIDVPMYRLLAVVFRLRPHPKLAGQLDPDKVYARLFKHIPKIDLEMLLPGTRVRMTTFDHGKIMLPLVSGVAIVLLKVIKGALIVALASFYGMLALLGLVGGTLGYGIRSFMGYMRTKERYQLAVTRNLYYQNLDNNAGALLRVFDEAEEQQFRKLAIACCALAHTARDAPASHGDIDATIARLVESVGAAPAVVRLTDVIAHLRRYGLSEPAEADCERAAPLEEACRRMRLLVERQIFSDAATEAPSC